MFFSKETLKDISRFAAGAFVLCALQEIVILILVFAFGLFKGQLLAMLLGTLYGSACVILSFAHMGYCVEKCLECDAQQGKKYMQQSYSVRLVVLAAALFVGIKLLRLNVFCVAIPLLYTRPVIMVLNMIKNRKRDKAVVAESDEEGTVS